ncbi:dihydrodipicolinate synthase/N-acetylneuraminate lyase [Pantoea piersonii]|jgi:4-hydroxy-tetrahydrodipicolinate synthase
MTREQRGRIARLAVDNAGSIPVMVCVGAVSTEQVLRLADDAQALGASALLLPPVSYQALHDDKVYGLFETVARHVSVPLCVYDNPGTTHFNFSDELHGKITALPSIHSVKIPGVSSDEEVAAARIRNLRGMLPPDVTIGISGGSFAATGMTAGCEVWYSVFSGLFPVEAKKSQKRRRRATTQQGNHGLDETDKCLRYAFNDAWTNSPCTSITLSKVLP